MAKIKTVEPGGKLVSFVGSLRLLEAEGLRQRVEVRLLNSLVNRNNWKYLNLEKHKRLFVDTPILVAYKGKKIGDGHNFEKVRNPDGSVTASFMAATAERIVGWFKSEEDIRVETIDNIEWIVGIGYIWKWYAQELVAKLNGQGGGDGEMSVSIETLIEEMHMEGSTEVYTKYQILGTTILGDDVAPAVADASIRALSAIGTEAIHEMTLRVASANPQPKDGENGPETGTSAPAKKHSTTGELIMNNKKMKEIEAKFPGFRVLAANGENLALLSEDGENFYTASYKEENGEILPGAKVAADVYLSVGDGEGAVKVNYAQYHAADKAKIAELTETANKAQEDCSTALAQLKTMTDRETERRKESAKNAIQKRFRDVCENSGADLAEDFCNSLLCDEKLSAYAAMEDKDGRYCGDEAACKDVDALCMDKVLEANKAKKARENAKKHYAWENGEGDHNEGPSGIAKTIANIMA